MAYPDLKVCDAEHDKIFYELEYCPLCKANKAIDELKQENTELDERLSSANDYIMFANEFCNVNVRKALRAK